MLDNELDKVAIVLAFTRKNIRDEVATHKVLHIGGGFIEVGNGSDYLLFLALVIAVDNLFYEFFTDVEGNFTLLFVVDIKDRPFILRTDEIEHVWVHKEKIVVLQYDLQHLVLLLGVISLLE